MEYPELTEEFLKNYKENIMEQLENEIQVPFPKMMLSIIIIGLPLTVLVICALLYQVQKDHVVPIYVINLHISDLIQFCCMAALVARLNFTQFAVCSFIYLASVTANISSMMCVALERYLVVAWPMWYRYKRSVKTTVLVCVIVWLFPIIPAIFGILDITGTFSVFITFFLLPFPVLVFSLVGTLKALSGVISVSSEEKRRIVGTLILVLVNYTLLYLPFIISLLLIVNSWTTNPSLQVVSSIFIMISPLADLFLYVFMSKGATEKLRAFLCCYRRNTQQAQS